LGKFKGWETYRVLKKNQRAGENFPTHLGGFRDLGGRRNKEKKKLLMLPEEKGNPG